MCTISENKKRLDIHYKTGYTQFSKYTRTFAGQQNTDLLNDVYLLILKAIENGNCKQGVSHNYIVRSLKLTYYDQKKLKRSYDNYQKTSLDILYDHDDYIYDPIQTEEALRERLHEELTFKMMISYVEKNFNSVEQIMFKLKYINGFTNKQIGYILSQEKYKYSDSKISIIFKRINNQIINHFKQKHII